MRVIFLLSILTVLVLSVGSVHAHSTGLSFEKAYGDYLVDIGYDSEEFVSGEQTNFSIGIIDSKTNEDAEFDDVWVRIEKEDGTIFATGIASQAYGETTLVFTFPEPGKYNLNFRYQKEGETLAEAAFPVEVIGNSVEDNQEKSERSEAQLLMPVFASFIVGAVVAYFLPKRKKGDKS